ncbi:MAG TPA: putative glycoside hydrolase [Gaiellaceae bacterium]
MLTPADPHAPNRLRRRELRRRQVRRRRLTALAIVAAGAGGVVGGVVLASHRTPPPPEPAAATQIRVPRVLVTASLRRLPEEIRGVHVTMALANVPGKLGQYLALKRDGLNTIELDVKDENGEIGFVPSSVPLASRIGAAKPYYRPREVARKVHAAGLYLIGRVVTFEDPIASERHPQIAVRRSDGSIWRTSGGLGWLNPYNRGAWRYDVDIAAAAARAGFDEIQFDYVRFPSDGDLSVMRFPGPHSQPMDRTVAAFLRYAARRLHPLGVRVSADVFGLSATRDLGIGQHPRALGDLVDAIYPMTYPSHYNAGEFNLPDPNAEPGPTVTDSLRDFRRTLRGTRALLVPWLQDFSLGRTYGPADVAAQVRAARAAQSGGFMLWNAEGLYTGQALAAGRRPIPVVTAPNL